MRKSLRERESEVTRQRERALREGGRERERADRDREETERGGDRQGLKERDPDERGNRER